MIVDEIKGYMEGRDITKIPKGYLAYPSKNVFAYKGKGYTRGGLVYDEGTSVVVQENIHSEFVWKDAKGGVRPIRAHGTTVEVKYNDMWYQLFTGLDADTVRVYFATWIDSNGSIIKKRLCFADGSSNLYQWNGAIGVVESATANTVTFATVDGTCLQQGFDDGSGTNQTIMHYIGTAVIPNSEELQTNNPTGQVLNISGTFNTTPIAGDIIIAKPLTHADNVGTGIEIDVVYTYKNAIISANFDSVNLYWSSLTTYAFASGWDFVQPVLASRTATTPVFQQLDGNFCGMIARKDVLWVSDTNDWYKMTKGFSVNQYGLWVDVEKFETGEQKGCMPMAIAIYKGDIVYFSQEQTLQRVVTNALTGSDELFLLSDEVEGLFNRLDPSDVRVYYLTRAIYVIFPTESTTVMLDMIENYFQPPQIIPMNCMSVIDGIKYGHHNVENISFELFSGRQDLDTDKECIFAFGYSNFIKDAFHPATHTLMGVSHRITETTMVAVSMIYEENGAVANLDWTINGSTITTFSVDDDNSWGTHPYGSRSYGGGDLEVEELSPAFTYDKEKGLNYLNFRPVFTVTGASNEWHLRAWYLDADTANTVISSNLFVNKT